MLDVTVPLRGDPWSTGEPEIVPTKLHEDLVLLPGSGPLSGDPSRRACRRLVGRLRNRTEERVVVDLPAGTTDRALDLWLASDVPLLVTVPERIPLEATFRLLARVFARLVRPWLDRKLGREAAGAALSEGWERSGGRAGTWMRSVARAAQLVPDEIADAVGRRPLYLVLNRVRRGDDVDVGHTLVTAAGHGLGLDLRFRGVISEDEDGWIRARRAPDDQGPVFSECLAADVHELIDRIAREAEVAPPGDLLWDLKDAAALVGNAGRRNRPPWR
jgi:MinD-like ATPase involved in chromosome partitioning or flagellar assembly